VVDGPHLVRPEAGDELHVDAPDGSIGGLISQVGHVRPAISLSISLTLLISLKGGGYGLHPAGAGALSRGRG